jgi:hypothetical protein
MESKMNLEKNNCTTFWGNSKQKIYADEIKWCSANTMIVHFTKIDVSYLETISQEVENRHYLHKYNNHYQYLGNVMSWNVIKIENGFVDLELVIKISLKYKNILFRTKNDVCASFGLPSIAPSNLVKKIIS